MRLTVIGGSGGIPGGGRPCSGYVIEARGFGLLVDPGYGVATALSAPGVPTFDAVLVTHGHPDHCADLNPLLRTIAWADPPREPLPVHALPGALDAVLALDRPELLAGSYRLEPFAAGDTMRIGPFTIETVLLPHPRPNAGIRVTADGQTLAYTGDCGPSEALVRLARDADLLLAEASYAAEVPEELVGALSSSTDAGRQASGAGVGRLVLTHLMPATDPDAAVAAARRSFAGSIDVARPGLVIDLDQP
jgi:ribonuclease BN (tRNA processing enzyme)